MTTSLRPWSRRLLILGALVALITLFAATPARAADTRGGQNVVIGRGEVIEGDLYVAANTLTVDGTIKGDLVAMAGQITVNGTITGDLLAGAQAIVINGTIGDDARVGVEGAVADDGALAVVEVEHRREAQVDAAGTQLGGEHVAEGAGGIGGAHRVAHPQLAERARGRQRGEAVAAKALHAAAFVVGADEAVGADRLHLGDDLGELAAAFEVAREKHEAAGERVRQAPAIGGVEPDAGDVDDEWCVAHDAVLPCPLRSTTTNAAT